jgi:hypothetical protein
MIRTDDEIQRAHDTLGQLVLEPFLFRSVFGNDEHQIVVANLDVLCWVLHHDHNRTFADNLEMVKERLTKLGYVLERKQ